MYSSTAGIGSSLQYLKKFPEYQNNQLLILAGLEMTIAYELLEARRRIWCSIFWKRSNSATKFVINKKMVLDFFYFFGLQAPPKFIVTERSIKIDEEKRFHMLENLVDDAVLLCFIG